MSDRNADEQNVVRSSPYVGITVSNFLHGLPNFTWLVPRRRQLGRGWPYAAHFSNSQRSFSGASPEILAYYTGGGVNSYCRETEIMHFDKQSEKPLWPLSHSYSVARPRMQGFGLCKEFLFLFLSLLSILRLMEWEETFSPARKIERKQQEMWLGETLHFPWTFSHKLRWKSSTFVGWPFFFLSLSL